MLFRSCEQVGANVDHVRIGIGSDERIGKRFLFAGIGYGGSCFPKDVQALGKIAQEAKYDFKLLHSVMQVNEKQKVILIDKIKKHFNNDLKGKKAAIWGLAFKPDTDDIREAPSLYMINALTQEGVSISAYDPEAMSNVRKTIGDKIHYATDPYDTLSNADFLIIATEWSVFRTPEFDRMKELMKSPVIFDGRNLYDLQRMKEKEFTYYSIGRETVKQ